MSQYSLYNSEDVNNPLGWRAVRQHIEDSAERSWLRQSKGVQAGILDRGIWPNKSLIDSYFKKPKSTYWNSAPAQRPGFINPNNNGIERPGFISGLD